MSTCRSSGRRGCERSPSPLWAGEKKNKAGHLRAGLLIPTGCSLLIAGTTKVRLAKAAAVAASAASRCRKTRLDPYPLCAEAPLREQSRVQLLFDVPAFSVGAGLATCAM